MSTPATGTALARCDARSFSPKAFATAGLFAAIGLATWTSSAAAQSFLEGKSPGMRDCVKTILKGERTAKQITVHGHHFRCRDMDGNTKAHGNYRQILLERVRFGMDDAYVINFRVDAQNAIVPGTLRIRTSDVFSTKRLLSPWKVSILATNSATAYFASHYYNQIRGFTGPASYSGLTYTQVANIAHTVPATGTKTWQTAAFQISLMTIAELGRSRTRGPALTKTATRLSR
ncbi:MAG: hypothetical protein MPJ78_19180 [Hyphomicrobiaceae bacterium]|nr:hypothetical protein [Hyphomicrobiaceae bacterium]